MNFIFDTSVTRDEYDEIENALKNAGIIGRDCFPEAVGDSNRKEVRRRAGQPGRPLMGSSHRANPRNGFQVRRQ